jgi:hypothetical protein
MYKQYKANQSNEIQIMQLIAYMWPVYSVLLEKAKPRHIPVETPSDNGTEEKLRLDLGFPFQHYTTQDLAENQHQSCHFM